MLRRLTVKGAYVMNLGLVPYGEAWELQRSLAGAVSQGAIPDTILLLEHPPTVTTGRRTEEGELHIPDGRGGRGRRDRPRRQVHLPRAGPARLLPDLRPEAARPGREALLPRARGGADPHAREARRRGRADRRADRRLADAAAAEDRQHRDPHRQVGDDARLRAQRRPRSGPFTQWITACGLEDAAFTTIAKELGRPVAVDEVRAPALEALAEVFGSSWRSCPPRASTASGRSRARPARRAMSGFGVTPTIRSGTWPRHWRSLWSARVHRGAEDDGNSASSAATRVMLETVKDFYGTSTTPRSERLGSPSRLPRHRGADSPDSSPGSSRGSRIIDPLADRLGSGGVHRRGSRRQLAQLLSPVGAD